MKVFVLILAIVVSNSSCASVGEFNASEFASKYFSAWVATQSPTASDKELEEYLSFLTEDVGHQHLPYDPEDERTSDGKVNMRKGMSQYLGAHTEYTGTLNNITLGFGVIVLHYDTLSKGVHPQTKEVLTQRYSTIEVLELENGKVSVIRKYSG